MMNNQIAIIDDGINYELLSILTGCNANICALQVEGGRCIRHTRLPVNNLNHGTICTALMVNHLLNKEHLRGVEILAISVANNLKNDLASIETALSWLLANNVEVISLSLGIKNFFASKRLLTLAQDAEKLNVAIVAAGSNDGSIAYPACSSSTIGVRVAKGNAISNIYYTNPVDGIDFELSFDRDNSILKRLETYLDRPFLIANSLLAPVVAAEIFINKLNTKTSLSVKETKKSYAMQKNMEICNTGNCKLSPIEQKGAYKNTIYESPIIVAPYTSQSREYLLGTVLKIQDLFAQNSYNCVCFSDISSKHCPDKNIFSILHENQMDVILRFAATLESSLLFCLINYDSDMVKKFLEAGDAIILYNSTKQYSKPTYDIIRGRTPKNIYDWLMEMFHGQEELDCGEKG